MMQQRGVLQHIEQPFVSFPFALGTPSLFAPLAVYFVPLTRPPTIAEERNLSGPSVYFLHLSTH